MGKSSGVRLCILPAASVHFAVGIPPKLLGLDEGGSVRKLASDLGPSFGSGSPIGANDGLEFRLGSVFP